LVKFRWKYNCPWNDVWGCSLSSIFSILFDGFKWSIVHSNR